MAQIKIDWPAPPIDGAEIKFKAPCDCTQVEGLLLCYVDAAGAETSKSFTFRDSHGYDLTGLGNLFCAGAYVKAMLDVKNGHAYLQNVGATAFSSVVTLKSGSWASNKQTVNVAGVKANSIVVVSAAPENHAAYCDSGVYCNAQAAGTLSFVCDNAPATDLLVNVSILS